MARILTGIQSSGVPHLGNVLGAIIPAIKMSKITENESLFFIADLHSLTSIKNAELIKKILMLPLLHGYLLVLILIKIFFIGNLIFLK